MNPTRVATVKIELDLLLASERVFYGYYRARFVIGSYPGVLGEGCQWSFLTSWPTGLYKLVDILLRGDF
jgi:hypothetical protein